MGLLKILKRSYFVYHIKEVLKGRLFINILDGDLALIDFINSKTNDLIALSSNEIDIEANVYRVR